jgi:hypothetical protein
MSDQPTTDGSVQNPTAAAAQQPQTPPVAPADPATAAPAADDPAPQWLPDRLKQARAAERKQLLQELGADDPAALKAKLKKLDELETEKLSDQERVEKLIKELTPKAEEGERYKKMFADFVDAQFSSLDEKTQQAIDAKANGNAERRWEFMQFMQTAGLGGPATTTPTPARPANTAPAGAQPPPAPAQPKTTFDKWNDLKKTDSVAASVFYQMNAMAIEQSRQS